MKGKRIIRVLTEEDWEKFKALDQSAFPEDCITMEQFFIRIERDENFGLFIEEDLEGILFVTRFGEDEGYIQKIAVSSLYQGKGY
ncbi:MAG: hypothetical protein P1Q69_19225, partial [Candidatus Thorarchaeota archaeon]|nr:hypothetical protein [Candidatus Thorarchaeota archaeon]